MVPGHGHEIGEGTEAVRLAELGRRRQHRLQKVAVGDDPQQVAPGDYAERLPAVDDEGAVRVVEQQHAGHICDGLTSLDPTEIRVHHVPDTQHGCPFHSPILLLNRPVNQPAGIEPAGRAAGSAVEVAVGARGAGPD